MSTKYLLQLLENNVDSKNSEFIHLIEDELRDREFDEKMRNLQKKIFEDLN